jgi:hypothetical protein
MLLMFFFFLSSGVAFTCVLPNIFSYDKAVILAQAACKGKNRKQNAARELVLVFVIVTKYLRQST